MYIIKIKEHNIFKTWDKDDVFLVHKKFLYLNKIFPKHILSQKINIIGKMKQNIIIDVLLCAFMWLALVFQEEKLGKKNSEIWAIFFLQDSISLIVLLCRAQLLSFRNSLEIYAIIEFACINKHIINNQWQLAHNELPLKFNYMLD